MTQPTFGEQPVSLQVADAQVEVPEWFRQYLRAGLKETFRSVPDEFVSWMVDKNSMYGLGVPIGQVIGFTQFTPKVADFVANDDSSTSTSYGDLAHVGPTLTELSAGSYMVFYWVDVFDNAAANRSFASLSINAAAPDDADALKSLNVGPTTLRFNITTKTLPEPNNTIQLKYRSGDGAVIHWSNRGLAAIKYANS
jgi:hypothetical protein